MPDDPGLQAVLHEMKSDPLGFLRHYKVLITGSGNASGLATFTYSHQQNAITRGFTTGLSRLFCRTKERDQIDFRMRPLPAVVPDVRTGTFNAWYVAMRQIGDAPETTHFALTGDGPDIMLTSQLTGCSFGIGSAAGNGSQLVSHIQPARGTRDGLHDAVVGGMQHGVAAIFERENQPNGYAIIERAATIIGIRRNGTWSYYAQLYGRGYDRTLYSAKKLA